jgi:hypothetical protein
MKVRSGCSPRFQRLVERDLVLGVRLVGIGIELVEGRAHHEERQEEAQADHHLVRRRRLRAEGLAQQAEHDDDAGEAGHQQQHGRQEAERREEQQGLDRHRVAGAAGALADDERQARVAAACANASCGIAASSDSRMTTAT